MAPLIQPQIPIMHHFPPNHHHVDTSHQHAHIGMQTHDPIVVPNHGMPTAPPAWSGEGQQMMIM